MDRNLGAMSGQGDNYSNAVGMYYQSGRKDLILANSKTVYSIKGTPKSVYGTSSNTQIQTYAYATKKPTLYFIGSKGYSDSNFYNLEDRSYSSTWHNPSWYQTINGKTLFDPCPQGWKLPASGFGSGIFSTKNRGSWNGGCMYYLNGLANGETTWYPGCGSIYNYSNYLRTQTEGYILYSNFLSNMYHNASTIYDTNDVYASNVRCIQE